MNVKQKRLSRRESQEQTRARLLEAAGKVFVRYGFDAASVEQIAEEAGFTRGAFYSNFASKDAIFLAVLERHYLEIRSALDAILREKRDAGERFQAARQWYASQWQQRKWILLKGEFSRSAQRNRAVRRRLTELNSLELESYASLIEQHFAEAGALPSHRPLAIALALLAAAEGLSDLSFLESDAEAERLFAETRNILFDSLLQFPKRGDA